MPVIQNRQKPPLIRITIASLIGVLVGYFLFTKFELSQPELKQEIKGTICLIIDDFGFSQNEDVQGFFQLNENMTMAIIPGTPYAKSIGEYADSLGIETIIHMPMESFENEDIIYNISLNDKLNAALVEKRVRYAFNEIPTALGMNNHQGSKATTSLQLMKDLARTLKKMDKFFLDSFTNPESRGYITMRRYGVPTELRQVFLDHIEEPEPIRANLDSLVKLSHHMNIAVGICHAKPLTLQVLKEEIPRLESEGYRFIRLSQTVH